MLLEAVVAAVLSGSGVCSDYYDNPARYMPTELSDYQKCVYQVHGTDYGVIGKNAWIALNDEYVYIPIDKIAGKSRSVVSKVVTLEITKAIAPEVAFDVAEFLNASTDETNPTLSYTFANGHTLTIERDPRYPWHNDAWSISSTLLDGREFIGGANRAYDFIEIFQEIASDAYNQGYEDGYAQGYADGYNQGFADGVASVSY